MLIELHRSRVRAITSMERAHFDHGGGADAINTVLFLLINKPLLIRTLLLAAHKTCLTGCLTIADLLTW